MLLKISENNNVEMKLLIFLIIINIIIIFTYLSKFSITEKDDVT